MTEEEKQKLFCQLTSIRELSKETIEQVRDLFLNYIFVPTSVLDNVGIEYGYDKVLEKEYCKVHLFRTAVVACDIRMKPFNKNMEKAAKKTLREVLERGD